MLLGARPARQGMSAHLPEGEGVFCSILVVALGLAVKERLQVLHPGYEKNVHDEFRLGPNEATRQKVNQAAILVENWHAPRGDEDEDAEDKEDEEALEPFGDISPARPVGECIAGAHAGGDEEERHEPLNQEADEDAQADADLVVLHVPVIPIEEPRTMKEEDGAMPSTLFQSTS
jgi:hypothetical protein